MDLLGRRTPISNWYRVCIFFTEFLLRSCLFLCKQIWIWFFILIYLMLWEIFAICIFTHFLFGWKVFTIWLWNRIKVVFYYNLIWLGLGEILKFKVQIAFRLLGIWKDCLVTFKILKNRSENHWLYILSKKTSELWERGIKNLVKSLRLTGQNYTNDFGIWPLLLWYNNTSEIFF